MPQEYATTCPRSRDHDPGLPSIELLLLVKEFTASGLLEGRDHVVADVSLIAEPVARVGGKEHSGFAEAMIIMAAPRGSGRISTPGIR
jgi:hypothetical protein